MNDKRNINVTNKLFQVINNVKGFNAAMGNPQKGVIIVQYEGTTFTLQVEPVYEDTPEGQAAENRPFMDIVHENKYMFK